MLLIILPNKLIFGEEAYFDLSDQEIEIQTNFNGKEVIIFGLTEPQFDTIITIKGPNKDTKVSKKERLFGFWFNTKKIIYRDLPSIFFIATSKPINEILNDDTYEYDEISIPFLAALGDVIYNFELSRKRDTRPNLTRFKIHRK